MTIEMQEAMENLKNSLVSQYEDSSEGASYYDCETDYDYDKYFSESLRDLFDRKAMYTDDAYKFFSVHSIAFTQLAIQYIQQYHENIDFSKLDMERFIQFGFNAIEEYCIGRKEMLEWFKNN